MTRFSTGDLVITCVQRGGIKRYEYFIYVSVGLWLVMTRDDGTVELRTRSQSHGVGWQWTPDYGCALGRDDELVSCKGETSKPSIEHRS